MLDQRQALPDRIWPKTLASIEDKNIVITNLRPGIRMIQMDLQLDRNVYIREESGNSPLEFGCLFSGFVKGSSRSGDRKNAAFECAQGQSWLSYYPWSDNSIEYFADKPIRAFVFQIEYTVLREYLPAMEETDTSRFQRDLVSGDITYYNKIKSITSNVFTLVDQIKSCPYQGVLKKLYLESKVFELLVCLIDAEAGKRKKSLSRADEERIRQAREILLENMESPLSLNELAKKAGLCATKLNKGFRQLYKNSVFGLLREERLAKARMLMETQEKRACEAAWEVGYSSLSSFHRAFHRKYGVNPGFYSKTGTFN